MDFAWLKATPPRSGGPSGGRTVSRMKLFLVSFFFGRGSTKDFGLEISQ